MPLNELLPLHRDERYLLEQLMRECATHTNMNLRVDTATSNSKLPVSVWIGGIAVRALFLVVLTVITARVASPQIENLRSVFETPSDLIRVTLGFAVCVWLIVNVFILPEDADAYRVWLYLGVAVLPLSLLCAYVAW
jgi:hypothetical protein